MTKQNLLTDAYVAGLIDGEGCLYMEKTSLVARLDVGMSEKAKPLLVALHQKYGGSLLRTRKATKRWAAAWCWALSGDPCLKLVENVAPHAALKREQMVLLLRLRDLRRTLDARRDGRVVWTAAVRRDAESLRILVQELNRKGPTETPAGDWFARYVGGQWLTPQATMFGHLPWEKFSESWPPSGMTRSGKVYRRRPLVPRTFGGASLWWPTPTVNGNYNRKGLSATSGDGLATAVRLRTPTASDAIRGPCSEPDKKAGSHSLTTQAGGALNPTWVEWLMGFPPNWTEV